MSTFHKINIAKDPNTHDTYLYAIEHADDPRSGRHPVSRHDLQALHTDLSRELTDSAGGPVILGKGGNLHLLKDGNNYTLKIHDKGWFLYIYGNDILPLYEDISRLLTETPVSRQQISNNLSIDHKPSETQPQLPL